MTYFSFSQHNDLRSCAKKWAYKRLDKIDGKPSTALIKGRQIHEQIEQQIKTLTTDPRIVWCQQTLKEYEIDNFEIEKKLTKKIDGITIVGVADIISEDTVLDWKTGKQPKSKDARTIDQLHLYGWLSDIKPKTLVGAYTEHDYIFDIDYDPERGEMVASDLIATAKYGEELKQQHLSAQDIKGTATPLCRYCEYYDLCPDNFDIQRKKLKK